MGDSEPPVWKTIESYAGQNDVFSAALLSIKARVEALEANSQPTPNPSQIRSFGEGDSLVKRVREAILNNVDGGDWADEARAAIRVIVGELSAQCFVHAADWLEQEAGR